MSYGKATLEPSEITSRIFLGTRRHAGKLDVSFNACLSVGNRAPCDPVAGVDYLHIPLADNGPVTHDDFTACMEFVLDYLARGERVLVCCDAGRNRSAAIVTAVLVIADEFPSWAAAFDHVKSRRPCVRCNLIVVESVLENLLLTLKEAKK
jgi:Dual specificity phosphatase, catalytic domain